MVDRRIREFGRFVDGGRVIRLGGCAMVAVVGICLITRHVVEGAMRGINTRRSLEEGHCRKMRGNVVK